MWGEMLEREIERCGMFVRIGRTFFFFNDAEPTEIYTSVHTLSLHDALPIYSTPGLYRDVLSFDFRSLYPSIIRRSEEHTSELQSRTLISYAVFCLKKKK